MPEKCLSNIGQSRLQAVRPCPCRPMCFPVLAPIWTGVPPADSTDYGRDPAGSYDYRLSGHRRRRYGGTAGRKPGGRDVLEHWNTEHIYHKALHERPQQLEYASPLSSRPSSTFKFTVSELKKRAYLSEESGEELYEEPDIVPLLPEFLEISRAYGGIQGKCIS